MRIKSNLGRHALSLSLATGAALSFGSLGACASTTSTSENPQGDGGGQGSSGGSSGGASSSGGSSGGGSSGASSGGGSGGSSGGTGSSGGGSGGGTGSSSGGSGSSSGGTVNLCPAPAAVTDSLPFAVDKGFAPAGEGDAAPVSGPGSINFPGAMGDPNCVGTTRSSATAIGNCHTVQFASIPAGTMVYGANGPMPSGGWTAMVWLSPSQNFGTKPGYPVPPGATKVTFWAKGAVGGEVVSFFGPGLGYGSTPTAAAPCTDTVNTTTLLETLTTTWTQYTLPINGTSYAGGVVQGFGFSLVNASEPTPDAGAAGGEAGADDASAGDGAAADAAAGYGAVSATFYIDDIRWEM